MSIWKVIRGRVKRQGIVEVYVHYCIFKVPQLVKTYDEHELWLSLQSIVRPVQKIDDRREIFYVKIRLKAEVSLVAILTKTKNKNTINYRAIIKNIFDYRSITMQYVWSYMYHDYNKQKLNYVRLIQSL